MLPTISILLPTHNQANLLSFAIRSVLAQSFQDFEVLIVGDGCTDNTGDVVRSFNDSRLKWYDLPKAPNFGYANRNIALREAKGKLIAYMTHDDLWLSDHLETFLPFFDDQNIEIVYSRPLWVIPRGLIVPGFFNIEHDPVRVYFLGVGNQIPSDCFVHRQECLIKYGYWDETISGGGDWDLWKRIIKGGHEDNFSYLASPTCLHFKADWHGQDYDHAFGFPAWKQAFASGQMPSTLQVEMNEEDIEQEVVWNIISSNHAKWNAEVRSAVRQITDTLAFQAIQVSGAIKDFNSNVMNESLPAYKMFGYDIWGVTRHLTNIITSKNKAEQVKETTILELESIKQQLSSKDSELSTNINELTAIKNTLTWKIHDWITGIKLVHSLYSLVIAPIKKLLLK